MGGVTPNCWRGFSWLILLLLLLACERVCLVSIIKREIKKEKSKIFYFKFIVLFGIPHPRKRKE
jgi:hypothetical protein